MSSPNDAGGSAETPKRTARNNRNRPARALRFDLRAAVPIVLDISDNNLDDSRRDSRGSKDDNENSNNDDSKDNDKGSNDRKDSKDSVIHPSPKHAVPQSPTSGQARPRGSQATGSSRDNITAASTDTLSPAYRHHHASKSLGSTHSISGVPSLWDGTSRRPSRHSSLESVPLHESGNNTRACDNPPKAPSKSTKKKPRKRRRPVQLGPEDIKLDDLLGCANKALGKFMQDQQVVHDLLSEPMRGPLACLGPVGSLVRLMYRAVQRDEALAPSRQRHQRMVHRPPAESDPIHRPIPGLPDTAPMFTSVHTLRAAPVLRDTMPGSGLGAIGPDRTLLDDAIQGTSGGAQTDDEDSVWNAIEQSENIDAGQSRSMAGPVWEAIAKNYSNKRAVYPTTTRPESPPPPSMHAWQNRRDFATRRQASLASFITIAEEEGGSISGPITQTFHKAVKMAKDITHGELQADQAEAIRPVREALLEAEDDIVLLGAEYDSLKSSHDQTLVDLAFVKEQLRLAIRDRLNLQLVVETSEHSRELKEHLVWLMLTDTEPDSYSEAPVQDDSQWEDLRHDGARQGELAPEKSSVNAELMEWWNGLNTGNRSDVGSFRMDYQGDVPLQSPWSPAAFAMWAKGSSVPGTPLSGLGSRSPLASRAPRSARSPRPKAARTPSSAASDSKRSSTGLKSPPLRKLPGTPLTRSQRPSTGLKSPLTGRTPGTRRALRFNLSPQHYSVGSSKPTRRTAHKSSRPLKSAMKEGTKKAAKASRPPHPSEPAALPESTAREATVPSPIASAASPAASLQPAKPAKSNSSRPPTIPYAANTPASESNFAPFVAQQNNPGTPDRNLKEYMMTRKAGRSSKAFSGTKLPSVYQSGHKRALSPMIPELQDTPEEAKLASARENAPQTVAFSPAQRKLALGPGLLQSILDILHWVFLWLWRQRTNVYLIVHWCMLGRVVPRFANWREDTTRLKSVVHQRWSRWMPSKQPDAPEPSPEPPADKHEENDTESSALPFPLEALAELMLFSGVLVTVFVLFLAIAERNLWLDSNASLPREYLYTYIMQYDRDTGSCSTNPYMFSSFFRSQYSSPPPATHSPYHICVCIPTFVDPRIALEPMGYSWLYISDLVWDFWRLLYNRRWEW